MGGTAGLLTVEVKQSLYPNRPVSFTVDQIIRRAAGDLAQQQRERVPIEAAVVQNVGEWK
jgi:hypothetical protein